ncbi:hypothetical protein KSB_36520 [Ktedonobacter robiniae]|uniref:Uncharacterized protein n=1 Tax=Ktedonobacter robiniae TaxID=2778365 RepID=A0ABQ3UR52_9CHLR|nr:hypothetical protein KSB_36520 [Ktedonobacter robiniae]
MRLVQDLDTQRKLVNKIKRALKIDVLIVHSVPQGHATWWIGSDKDAIIIDAPIGDMK